MESRFHLVHFSKVWFYYLLKRQHHNLVRINPNLCHCRIMTNPLWSKCLVWRIVVISCLFCSAEDGSRGCGHAREHSNTEIYPQPLIAPKMSSYLENAQHKPFRWNNLSENDYRIKGKGDLKMLSNYKGIQDENERWENLDLRDWVMTSVKILPHPILHLSRRGN